MVTGLSDFRTETLVCLPFVLLLLFGCDQPLQRLVKGEAVPDFELIRLDGTPLAFPASQQGEVAVIQFWADWCSLCVEELRDAEGLYQALRKRGLAVIAINVQQSRETVRGFIADRGLSYEILLDQQGDVARRYGVVGLPATFIVDRRGKLHTRIIGGTSSEQLLRIINELL